MKSNFLSFFLQDRWEPGLRALISNIRTKFSDAFDRIGCAGDVELVPDPDYAQWRVDIRVKFRDNEKLQLLTGQRQSGGVGFFFFSNYCVLLIYAFLIGALAHYDPIPHVPYYTCTYAFLAGRRDQSGYGSTSREDGT